MKSTLLNCLLLSTVLIISACSDSNEGKTEVAVDLEKEAPFTIVDMGSKEFTLDFETSVGFDASYRYRQFDGRDYLSFANLQNRMIYEFDYESGQPTRKIKLAAEGPNQINFSFKVDIYYHSPDSIFIDSGTNGYYLINGKGEVLLKTETKKGKSGYNSDCCPISFDNGTYYEKGTLYGRQSYKVNDAKENEPYEFGSIDPVNLTKTKKLLPSSLFIPKHREILEMESAKDPWVINFKPSFHYQQALLYAATPIGDSVYVFKELELVDQFYVGNASVELVDYRSYMLLEQIEQLNKGMQRVSVVDQPPHYNGLFVSPNGNIIYRLLIEGTKAKFIENTGMEIPEVNKASLVVYNKTTLQTATYDLPVEEITVLPSFNKLIFANDHGLHIQTKEQESEDELVFRVFGPADNH